MWQNVVNKKGMLLNLKDNVLVNFILNWQIIYANMNELTQEHFLIQKGIIFYIRALKFNPTDEQIYQVMIAIYFKTEDFDECLNKCK